MKNIGGSIPCEDCCCMVVEGEVYKVEKSSLCYNCYSNADEMYVYKNSELKQFEED